MSNWPPRRTSQQLKRASRRVHLAVKASVHNVQVSKPEFDSASDTHHTATTDNIDAALSSLYDEYNDVASSSSSYVPKCLNDWLLDGNLLEDEDANETEQLFAELHSDPMLGLMEALEKFSAIEKKETDDDINIESEEKKEVDDDDFGEFQSASMEEEDALEVCSDASEFARDVDIDEPTPARILPSCLETNDLVISASYKLDTPELLQLSEKAISSLHKITDEAPDNQIEPDHQIETDFVDNLSPASGESGYPQQVSDSVAYSPYTSEQPGHSNSNHNEYMTSSVPVSLRLPTEDLNSLEGRFTRRRQKEYLGTRGEASSLTHSPHASLADFDLPNYYFTCNNIDDSLKFLESLPWYYVLDADACDLDLWDDSITTRLCDLDAALQHVNEDQLQQVQPHKTCLDTANRLIHEWENNLRLANMYWDRSNTAVERAAGSEDDDGGGLKGMQRLLVDFNSREDLRALDSVMEDLVDVWSRERELMERIDCYNIEDSGFCDELGHILELGAELKQKSNSGHLGGLDCLVETRENLNRIEERFVQRLHQLTRVETVRFCRFVGNKDNYERLHFVLSKLSLSSVDTASNWAENIVAAICYEVERSLAVALLESDNINGSEYCQELRKLECEVDSQWGDNARLRTLSHNLVTIRFNFESKLVHLPNVIAKMCDTLLCVLHTFCEILDWHQAKDETLEPTTCFSVELSKRSRTVWNSCTTIIAKCLDEFFNFSPRKKLFSNKHNTVCDDLWREDLQQLHEVLCLVVGFLGIEREYMFSCIGSLESINELNTEDSNIMQLMAQIVQRHLRSVHIEAMNTIGRCLAGESWSLRGFLLRSEPERTGPRANSLQDLIRRAMDECSTSIVRPKERSDPQEREKKNRFSSTFRAQNGLPKHTEYSDEDNSSPNSIRPVSELLEKAMLQNEDNPLVAPEAVTQVVLQWFSRLVSIMRYLPIVHDDVSAVFANLSDLYFTTVLRICAKNGKSERIILASELPSPYLPPKTTMPTSNSEVRANSAASLFKSFRNSKRVQSASAAVSRQRVVLPSNLNSEICSPIPTDSSRVEKLEAFIQRGQKSLSDVVNLDMVDSWLQDPHAIESQEEKACEIAQLLSKQEAAITGCLLVSVMLDVVCTDAISLLNAKGNDFDALRHYNANVAEVVPTLCDVARKISCVRAIDGRELVKDIVAVGSGWSESKLHSQCNDYVDELCDRCSLIWGYLKISGKVPDQMLANIWDCTVSMVYQSVVEGFSRVQFCSTEGRALMALDLASLNSGLAPGNIFERLKHSLSVDAPPTTKPQFDRNYVEIYVKVFYYPKGEVMEWIQKNRESYKINHALALAVASLLVCESDDAESIPELMEKVKQLHHNGEVVESDENFSPSLSSAGGETS